MNKLKILRRRGNQYRTKCSSGFEYDFTMFFEDVEYEPEEGDYLFISNDILLDFEECETPRFYGPYSMESFVRKPEYMTDVDFMIVVNDERMEIYHRYYG